MATLSTLCYIEKDNQYLMLHRTIKKNDVNKDKWIGVGGHFETDESPEECLLREVREETGYILISYQYRGIVTFVSGNGVTEYMSLFTADAFVGEAIPCDEGELEWVDKDAVWKLNIWEGDKIFFRLLEDETGFFSLKLVYDGQDKLVEAALNGQPMELFDIRREDGSITGKISERGVVHREGSLHGTAHIWVVRKNQRSGYDLMLQKRSQNKDSHPGAYDISSAGHMEAGRDFMETALRELEEELGIRAKTEDLHFVDYHRAGFQKEFYGTMFIDNEYSAVYVYQGETHIDQLYLQESEVESVIWMDYRECLEKIRNDQIPNCIHEDELHLIGRYLGIPEER